MWLALEAGFLLLIKKNLIQKSHLLLFLWKIMKLIAHYKYCYLVRVGYKINHNGLLINWPLFLNYLRIFNSYFEWENIIIFIFIF